MVLACICHHVSSMAGVSTHSVNPTMSPRADFLYYDVYVDDVDVDGQAFLYC